MKKLKKVLMIVSLVCIGIVAFMLASSVFGVNVYVGWPFKVMIVLAIVGATSGIAIGELNVVKRKKILGFVGLALLGVSAIMATILFLTPLLGWNLFAKFTLALSITSILFITIITQYSKLGKSVLVLQIITALILGTIDIILSLIIFGVNVFAYTIILDLFIVFCIAAVTMLIALTIIGSRKKDVSNVVIIKTTDDENKKETQAKASQNEFPYELEFLKRENELLKGQIELLKQQNETLKLENENLKSAQKTE